MNIILIISDTFRYDNLFGESVMKPRTPNIDEFTDRAVSLTQMYAAGFPTTSHRRNVISGRHWPSHAWEKPWPEPVNIMPRVFTEAGGYVTQFLADCPHLVKMGFHTYFDAAHTLRGQEGMSFSCG